jgi:hypothetical protein
MLNYFIYITKIFINFIKNLRNIYLNKKIRFDRFTRKSEDKWVKSVRNKHTRGMFKRLFIFFFTLFFAIGTYNIYINGVFSSLLRLFWVCYFVILGYLCYYDFDNYDESFIWSFTSFFYIVVRKVYAILTNFWR